MKFAAYCCLSKQIVGNNLIFYNIALLDRFEVYLFSEVQISKLNHAPAS